MYKAMRKHQNGFFSTAQAVLDHHKHFTVEENAAGLNVLLIGGTFVASCNPDDTEDMVLYFGNRETQRQLNK